MQKHNTKGAKPGEQWSGVKANTGGAIGLDPVTAYIPRCTVRCTYAHWPGTGPRSTPTESSGPACSPPLLHALTRVCRMPGMLASVWGQDPEDFSAQHPQPPQMSRFKPSW